MSYFYLFYIIIISFFNQFSFQIIYLKCEINCGNDYPDYITSSEGKYYPLNPNHLGYAQRGYKYIFKFDIIKHNLKEPLCIEYVNLAFSGGFAFNYLSINEYIIDNIDFKKYFFCNNCNANYVPKNFITTTSTCSNGNPGIIATENPGNFAFCLSPNNLTNFYINKNEINQKFYKGKIVKYILNDEINTFNIDNIFTVNEKEDLNYYLDSVTLKIVNITNKKGNIYNGDEELFENSFFNAKNTYLTHKRINDDGYLMIIEIITIPLNLIDINISTCEERAKIYLYVNQKNCTMNETSENFCQQCISDYGKNENENKCYDKSDKINNLYYDNSSQKWKICEINKDIFICSICPKGTYIKDPLSQICEKCDIGYLMTKWILKNVKNALNIFILMKKELHIVKNAKKINIIIIVFNLSCNYLFWKIFLI